MDTNFKTKIVNSLMPLFNSGAGKLKLVAILSFVMQGLEFVNIIITRSFANVIGMLITIFLASLLWKQADYLTRFQRTGDEADLHDALRQESLYWMIVGVLIIVFLALIIIGVLGAIALGVNRFN